MFDNDLVVIVGLVIEVFGGVEIVDDYWILFFEQCEGFGLFFID